MPEAVSVYVSVKAPDVHEVPAAALSFRKYIRPTHHDQGQRKIPHPGIDSNRLMLS